jgi:tetratricopeptide (TPR) repeat protein
VEIAQNQLTRARAFLLEGQLDVAETICRETFEVANADAPAFAANARAVLGQILAAHGDAEGAKSMYRQAVFFLTGAGSDRDAAQLWFELADLLEDVGDLDASRAAYRSAAATTGLRSRARARASAPVSVPTS